VPVFAHVKCDGIAEFFIFSLPIWRTFSQWPGLEGVVSVIKFSFLLAFLGICSAWGVVQSSTKSMASMSDEISALQGKIVCRSGTEESKNLPTAHGYSAPIENLDHPPSMDVDGSGGVDRHRQKFNVAFNVALGYQLFVP
jgi:hypothetical protein